MNLSICQCQTILPKASGTSLLLASTKAMHTSNLRQTTQKRGSADFTGFAQTK